MITITLGDRTYSRDYKPNFCKVKGCNQRITFKLSSKGVPESAHHYNKRRACCTKHAQQLRREDYVVKTGRSIVDDFLFGRLAK